MFENVQLVCEIFHFIDSVEFASLGGSKLLRIGYGTGAGRRKSLE